MELGQAHQGVIVGQRYWRLLESELNIWWRVASKGWDKVGHVEIQDRMFSINNYEAQLYPGPRPGKY